MSMLNIDTQMQSGELNSEELKNLKQPVITILLARDLKFSE